MYEDAYFNSWGFNRYEWECTSCSATCRRSTGFLQWPNAPRILGRRSQAKRTMSAKLQVARAIAETELIRSLETSARNIAT